MTTYPQFDPTIFPQVRDCFDRIISARRAQTVREFYACPFCSALLNTASVSAWAAAHYAGFVTCDNPACDAAPWISRETAVTRAHAAAIEENYSREQAWLSRVRMAVRS